MGFLPEPLYRTPLGAAYLGDALELLRGLPEGSVDLVLTSPPFPLQRQKEYGNVPEEEYVDWFLPFAREIGRVLKETGSLVLDLGGVYRKGRPVRSTYNYRLLVRMCEEEGWNLAQEFFWFNPSRLPSPIEWVNKRKIRVKDAVNTVWWLSKTDFPKADARRVLVPYSKRMRLLLRKGRGYYSPGRRPSGHGISSRFLEGKGGAIPPNLLQIPNTESNSQYLRYCRASGAPAHPARWPEGLPGFFIRFLTEPGDIVLDPFAGSNTTGAVAEALGRRWIALEANPAYLAASAFRFLPKGQEERARALYRELLAGRARGILLPQGEGEGQA